MINKEATCIVDLTRGTAESRQRAIVQNLGVMAQAMAEALENTDDVITFEVHATSTSEIHRRTLGFPSHA